MAEISENEPAEKAILPELRSDKTVHAHSRRMLVAGASQLLAAVKDQLWLQTPGNIGTYLRHWRAHGRTLAGDRTKTPVLVLQQGKVGSQTITGHLTSRNHPVLHTHHVTERSTVWIKEAVERGAGKRQWAARKLATVRVAQNLVRSAGDRRLKVIIPVRDPIARSLSLCFHKNKSLVRSGKSEEEIVPRLIAAYHELFWTWADATPWEAVAFAGTSYFDGTQPDWFERELITGLNLPADFLAPDLDFGGGFQIVSAGTAEMLFIRTEAMDECLPGALKRFLGLEIEPSPNGETGPVTRNNVRKSSLYKVLCDNVRLTEPQLDHLLASRTAMKFFRENERVALRKRWTTDRNSLLAHGSIRPKIQATSGCFQG